jgi:hypothetical protein
MTTVWEAVIPIGLFMVVAYVIKTIVENGTRRKLIDKGMVDENVKYLYADVPESRILSALKWGMVAIAIGLAIFVGQMVRPSLQEEVTIGCMFLFGGIGLVIYYVITRKTLERSRKENSGPPVP